MLNVAVVEDVAVGYDRDAELLPKIMPQCHYLMEPQVKNALKAPKGLPPLIRAQPYSFILMTCDDKSMTTPRPAPLAIPSPKVLLKQVTHLILAMVAQSASPVLMPFCSRVRP